MRAQGELHAQCGYAGYSTASIGVFFIYDRNGAKTMMIPPESYQWFLLAYCALVAFIVGSLDFLGGASSDSRFYPVDRIVVRLLGVGLMIFSVLIFLRLSWAFYGLIICFALSIVESLLTFRPEVQPVAKRLPASTILKVWIVFQLLIFGVPIVFLMWLRPLFTNSQWPGRRKA